MADQTLNTQRLINADKDFQTVEDFIKKPKDETVTTRFGDEIMTLKGLEEEVKKSGGYFKRYATLAAANADIANIPVSGVVKIVDSVGGDYYKASSSATSLTKSQFSPATTEDLNALKSYIYSEMPLDSYVSGLVIESDLSINNAASAEFRAYYFECKAGDEFELTGRLGSSTNGKIDPYIVQLDEQKNPVATLASFTSSGDSNVYGTLRGTCTQAGFVYIRARTGLDQNQYPTSIKKLTADSLVKRAELESKLGPIDSKLDAVETALGTIEDNSQEALRGFKSLSSDDAVAIAITFLDGSRTWLEVGYDGNPSTRSLQILKRLIGGGSDKSNVVPLSAVPSNGSISEYPQFERMTSPLISFANQSAETIYWTWMVNKEMWGGTGLALFYSTDHAASHTPSGIYLLEAETLEGPWLNKGKVYRDDFSGDQTETPSIIYDPVTQKVLMYYQQSGVNGARGVQQTCLATADPSDLTTWTRVGVALQMEDSSQDGDGHCGYFRPFKYNGDLLGYSLYGGTNFSNAALWRSKDGGYTWQRDGSMLGWMQDKCKHLATALNTTQNLCVLSIYEGDVINWGGHPWWIGVVGVAQSGSVAIRNSRLVAAPLTSDFRSLQSSVIDITPTKATYENVEGIDYPGNIFEWRGEIYSAYRTNGQRGDIGIMKLV